MGGDGASGGAGPDQALPIPMGLRQTVAVSVVAAKPVGRDLWPALVDLFGRVGASNGCWCMYWILGAEYHRRPAEANKQALHRAAMAGPAPGLLALDQSGTAVGWCRLTPRAELTWLNRRQDPAPVDDLPVWSLPCFYVRRRLRHQGVMTYLIDAAVQHARNSGAPAVEAYPWTRRYREHPKRLSGHRGRVREGRVHDRRTEESRPPDHALLPHDLLTDGTLIAAARSP